VKQDKNEKCSLTIECLFLPDASPLLEGAIICGSQRLERIVGQSFYVSEKNAADILEEQKDEIWLFPSEQAEPRVPDADRILGKYIAGILDRDRADKYLSALLGTAALISDITPVMRLNYQIAMGALAKHAVRTLITGRHGIIRTVDLRPGTYYVFGVFGAGKETCVWNVRTKLEAGENYLRLDDHNVAKQTSISS
jgi:hypothetical protein